MSPVRDVCVLGLGLVGGSVLRAAVAGGRHAWGASVSQTDTERAAADGFTTYPSAADALRAAAEADALIVLAVPLPAVDVVLGQVAAYAPNCLITDVVSVKRPVAEAVEHVLPGARYVGGHPMAGTAESGWAAGSAELFRGAAWVVGIEEETPVADWLEVAGLALDCGAQVVPAGLDEHDAAVAPNFPPAAPARRGARLGRCGRRSAGTRPGGRLVLRRHARRGKQARAGPGHVRGQPGGAARRRRRRPGPARCRTRLTGVDRFVGSHHQRRPRGARAADGVAHGGPAEQVQVDLGEPDALDMLLSYGSAGGRVVALAGKTVTVQVVDENSTN